jgi:hypothetical protein
MVVVHAGLVLLVEICMIRTVLIISAVLAVAWLCQIALTIFSFNFISLKWLQCALVVHVRIVSIHDLRISVTIMRFLTLLRTHDHLLVQFVLAIVAVALTSLSHI